MKSLVESELDLDRDRRLERERKGRKPSASAEQLLGFREGLCLGYKMREPMEAIRAEIETCLLINNQ